MPAKSQPIRMWPGHRHLLKRLDNVSHNKGTAKGLGEAGSQLRHEDEDEESYRRLSGREAPAAGGLGGRVT